jgi:hypothetical protein
LQASLQDTVRPVGLARDSPAEAGADVAMPGLQNETGEYNCFLNVIIQCLWHCSDFRAGLMGLPPDMLQGAVSLVTDETLTAIGKWRAVPCTSKPVAHWNCCFVCAGVIASSQAAVAQLE